MDLATPVLGILLLVLGAAAVSSHDAVSPRAYWKTVLPGTPMPRAVSQLLIHTGTMAEKRDTTVYIGKGGIHINTGKGEPDGTDINIGHGGVRVNAHGKHGGGGGGAYVYVGRGGVHVNARKGKPGGTYVDIGHGRVGVDVHGKQGGGESGTSVSVGKGGIHVNAGKGKPGGTDVEVGRGGVGVDVHGKHGGGGGTHVGVSGGGVYVHTNSKKKPTHVKATPFDYEYAATANQVNASRDVAIFFLEKDLHAGERMSLHFTKTTAGSGFLARRTADEIPFASKNLPEILARFGIEPGSDDALAVASTLKECEVPSVAGETKACVTSLESMVDFATRSLGTRHVVAASTTVEMENPPKQVYSVSGVKQLKVGGAASVACHAQPYVFAVFYCHATEKTRVYEVSMKGEVDGGKVRAVVVCHTDTGKWNPRHLAFQLLGVEPGKVPVCHFLPEDHVVWTPAK